MLPTAKGEEQKVTLKSSRKWVQKAAQQGGGGCNNLYYGKDKLRNGVDCVLQKLSASDRFAPFRLRSHNGIGRIAIGSDQSYF